MSTKKKFTSEEMETLRENPYTESVTADVIRFTQSFKEEFWRLSVEGNTGNAAFRKLGYDPEVLGFERVHNITKRIRRAAKTLEGVKGLTKSRMRISKESYGVLVPGIVRPRENGGYEIIAGHRRHRACERVGLTAMPCVVRNVDYDTAIILMVDSNIQRENTPISERAKAIKMKYEAIKRQGARTDLTSPKISAKLRSDDEIDQQMGMSGDTVRNYMALTELVPELMQMVDDKKIALTPAYQLAALTQEEQVNSLPAGCRGFYADNRQAILRYPSILLCTVPVPALWPCLTSTAFSSTLARSASRSIPAHFPGEYHLW